jgi:hypothetical protein
MVPVPGSIQRHRPGEQLHPVVCQYFRYIYIYGNEYLLIWVNHRKVAIEVTIHGSHGPSLMGLIHTFQHPPQSELPAQRSSRLNKKEHTQPPQTQLATGDVEYGRPLVKMSANWEVVGT